MNTIFNYLRNYSFLKWASKISFCIAFLILAMPSSAFAQNSQGDALADDASTASLSIMHSAMQGYVSPGETAGFTIAITNTGRVRLESIKVSNPDVPDCDRTFDAMVPNQVFTYTCELADIYTTVNSHLTVIGTVPNAPLLVLSSTVRVDVINAVLTIVKEPVQGQARSGERIVTSYNYTNSGSGAAVGVQIVELVPEGTKFVPEASAEGWSCQNDSIEAGTICVYSIDRIEAGDTATNQFPFVVVKLADDTDTEETNVSGSGSPVEKPNRLSFFLPLING